MATGLGVDNEVDNGTHIKQWQCNIVTVVFVAMAKSQKHKESGIGQSDYMKCPTPGGTLRGPQWSLNHIHYVTESH